MNRRVAIVLLIEHEAAQSVTLARALKGGGYSVIAVRRADDALETFATHHMDIALVVADTESVPFAGPPLLVALRMIDPRVPVIAMSPAAAIDAGAEEHLNVVATLTKPVAADDLITHVARLMQSPGWQDLDSFRPACETGLVTDHDLLTAGSTPTLRDWVDGLGGASFRWPPTEEELDDIQVVDTRSGGPWQPDRRMRLVNAPPPLTASPAPQEPIAAPAAAIARAAPAAQTAAPVKVAPPLQLVVRHSDDRPRTRRFTFPRIDRWGAVAATALCGLALTTLLELRGAPVKRAGIADNPSAAAVSTVLSARRDHVGLMSIVPAERVRSRFDSRALLAVAFQPEHRVLQPERSIAASRRDIETRTPGAAAPSLPRVAVRPATSPVPLPAPAAPAASRVEVADARIEPAAARDAVASTNVASTNVAAANVPAPAVARPREDERGIYQVLQQYERAFEQLNVDAAHAVWPSLNTRALARAFNGLKEQALEFSHCRVAMESLEATAICDGRASYVPRVGPQTARTEPREWTFRLQKVDHDWLIAKAEVR
jgi:CheY-like chemotaxis protein